MPLLRRLSGARWRAGTDGWTRCVESAELGILIPMSAHKRADEWIADLVAQEFDVFRAAYVPILVRRACLARLAPAATRPGHP